MFYTYVLRTNEHDFYIGWTNDLQARLIKHNRGEVKSTKTKTPLQLVYYEACLSRDKAIMREKQLKSGYGRAYLNRRIK